MGNNRRQVEDVHVLLALHEESYKHLHHLQNLRATYFNFYLVVVTAGVAGLVGVASAFGEVGWQNLVILGFVLWATSLFMLARAERLAGLVTHELVMLRRIRSHLRDKYPILSGIQSAAQSPIDGVEFWRPVWSRDKNVESLICILISIAGIAVFSGIASCHLGAMDVCRCRRDVHLVDVDCGNRTSAGKTQCLLSENRGAILQGMQSVDFPLTDTIARMEATSSRAHSLVGVLKLHS